MTSPCEPPPYIALGSPDITTRPAKTRRPLPNHLDGTSGSRVGDLVVTESQDLVLATLASNTEDVGVEASETFLLAGAQSGAGHSHLVRLRGSDGGATWVLPMRGYVVLEALTLDASGLPDQQSVPRWYFRLMSRPTAMGTTTGSEDVILLRLDLG